MTCQELADFLMAYLDGDLPEDERESFAHHLQVCPPCVRYLDTYKKAVGLGRSLCDDPAGPVPDDVPEELVRAILAVRPRS